MFTDHQPTNKSELIISADDINREHALARSSADAAVAHAIRCGELLAQKKAEVGHGKFITWIEAHCEFSERTARVYMRASDQNGRGLPFSSLSALLKSDRDSKPAITLQKPETVPPQQTQESPPVIPASGPPSVYIEGDDEPERPDISEEEEAAEFEIIEREYAASIEKVLAADDKLQAAADEIKRQAAEIAILKQSRDHYMGSQTAAVRLLKAEQRKTNRLSKRVERLEGENEHLRERIAIMEVA